MARTESVLAVAVGCWLYTSPQARFFLRELLQELAGGLRHSIEAEFQGRDGVLHSVPVFSISDDGAIGTPSVAAACTAC